MSRDDTTTWPLPTIRLAQSIFRNGRSCSYVARRGSSIWILADRSATYKLWSGIPLTWLGCESMRLCSQIKKRKANVKGWGANPKDTSNAKVGATVRARWLRRRRLTASQLATSPPRLLSLPACRPLARSMKSRRGRNKEFCQDLKTASLN